MITNEANDNTNYTHVEKQAAELIELIQKVRTEANLPRTFKAKRPHSLTENIDDAEESLQQKRLKSSDEPEIELDDRADLMARLSTFSILFHYIPRPLDALQCAKHGWKDTHSSIDKDPKICVLSCDSCNNNMFVIDVDFKICNEQKATEIKKKYTTGLYECHKEDCQWRENQCEDSAYSFPLAKISEGLEQFQSEAQHMISACISQNQTLPHIQHPLDQKTLSKVEHFATSTTTVEKALPNPETAYLLSVYGWKSLHPSIPGVRCDLCFTKKAFSQLKGEIFSIVDEHKSYCPWINVETANVYTPNVYSKHKNMKINGSDWMKDVMLLEYAILIKKEDLSLLNKQALDEKLYALKQKIYTSSDTLKAWQSTGGEIH